MDFAFKLVLSRHHKEILLHKNVFFFVKNSDKRNNIESINAQK
jgi:hypothetical protein